MTDPFLIWSDLHRAWYRPDAAGYTARITEAGVFEDRDVEETRERKVYLDEAYADLMAQRAALYRALGQSCEVEARLRGWSSGTVALAHRAVADVAAVLIDELEFSVRTSNCLHGAGIKTIGDLVGRTEAELRAIKHLGVRSLREIKQVLGNLDLRLASREPA